MENLLVIVEIVCPVLFASAGVSSGNTSCQGNSIGRLRTELSCYGVLYQPICLLCNTSRSSKEVSWYVEQTRLADKGYNFDSSHAGGLAVNGCPQFNYSSLRLEKPTTLNHNSVYYCQYKMRNVSAFILQLRADAILRINNSKASNGKLLLEHRTSAELQCIISHAIPPLLLVWSLNNKIMGEKMLNTTSEVLTTFSYTLNFKNLKTNDTLTCSGEGTYIESDNASLKIYIHHRREEKDEKHFPGPADSEHQKDDWYKILIPAGFVATLLIIFSAFIRLRRCSKQSSWNIENVQRGTTSTSNADFDGAIYEPYSNIGDVVGGSHAEAVEDSHEISVISMDSKVKFSGIYEYWIGTCKIDEGEESKCFSKSLSGQATLQEASEFQALAKSIKSLKDSTSVVCVLCINIDENPFSIVYELMEYGTLRDFVMSRYQQQPSDSDRGETSFKSQSRELLTFAINVASAMAFVVSQNFRHPILSLKKVLLTSQCCCKLYDIYPSDMAMNKIEEVRKKAHPPTAWMSPETIFLREYSDASDAWSFSTLLWELFSLGEIPYAGNQDKEIEENIRKGILLTQPPNCPGSVYGLMLLAWAKNGTTRPTFHVMLHKLQEILKAIEEDETSEAPQYFTLQPSQTNDYI